jgi:hypothetical protein
MPTDGSTGVLIDSQGAHRDSASVLRILMYLQTPWNVVGYLSMWLVPAIIRDAAYQAFARNRGTIWRNVKNITGLGDTKMSKYRSYIFGLEEERPLPPGWGFNEDDDDNAIKKMKEKNS